MTTTGFLVIVAIVLLVWGGLTAWIAGRYGQDRFGWWVAGSALGPLVIPALVAAIRDARRETHVADPTSEAQPAPRGERTA